MDVKEGVENLSPPRLLHTLASLAMILPVALFAQLGSASAASSSGFTSLTPDQINVLSQNVGQKVIVILKDQHQNLGGRIHATARTSAIEADQKPILGELSQVKAQSVKPFHIANMIAATVSGAEAKNLEANPAVLAVVPDGQRKLTPFKSGDGMGTDTAPLAKSTAGLGTPSPASAACGTASNPTLEPEALQVSNTAFNNPATPQAQSLFDGSGVNVAIIADGLDPNNPDFQRSGHSVVTDYEDFTGSGLGAPTGGAEAFGDASSIASQANTTWNVWDEPISIYTPQSPCDIRIKGMAPGANLMVLRAFGGNTAFNSTLALAVQYAVDHGADVINESFGGNAYPDLSKDPVSLADDAAVADGVTVVESTGDAGTTNTISSSATDPNVIAAGATTTTRLYAQTGYPLVLRPGYNAGSYTWSGGWLSNNPASLSSDGISEAGTKTVDVVAPGDSGWADCTPNRSLYTECSADILQFGGTSEASPLVAGEAALVIQAYRSGHGGATPSPLLVKQIIKGTATDLDLPSTEQGAGLIDSLKAVKAAESYNGPDGPASSPVGNSLIYSTGTQSDTLAAKALPGTSEHFPITVTNAGNKPEIVRASARTLAAPFKSYSFSEHFYGVRCGSGSPPVTTNCDQWAYNSGGSKRVYDEQDFYVPAGTQHLNAALAFPDNFQGHFARLILFDPHNNIAGWSDPQGVDSQQGLMELRDPASGTWHAITYLNPGVFAPSGGDVGLDITLQKFTSAGTVTPSIGALAPGQTMTFTANLKTLGQPGDESADVVLNGLGPVPTQTVVPVILRSTVPLTGVNAGQFAGVLTGGNGRAYSPGQVLTYDFNVPAGEQDLDLSMALQDNTWYNLQGMLVAPNGMTADNQSTLNSGLPYLQLYARNPVAGDWKFILFINLYTLGDRTQEPFTGQISFNQAANNISAPTMPTSSTTIAAGGHLTVPINITNASNVPESYFADPRLSGQQDLIGLNFLYGGNGFFYIPAAPTETTQLNSWFEAGDFFGSNCPGTTPVSTELYDTNGASPYGGQGSPDVSGTPFFDGVSGCFGSTATIAAPEVPAGEYGFVFGPTPPFDPVNGAPAIDNGVVNFTALTQAFDANCSSDTGDFWQDANYVASTGFAGGKTINPGASDAIHVTFSPPASAAPGTVVSGVVYVNAMDFYSPYNPNNQVTGTPSELISIPYSYTVG